MEIKIQVIIDDEALHEAIDKRIAELKQESDFVLVTRCKDCKYAEIDDACFPDQYLCKYYGVVWNNGDHFCGYAKPKEIEGERE